MKPEQPLEFSTDDGEPSGTAGTPILNLLRSRDLINIVCVVVRYYGGTKLGKSGLISAYSHTANLTAEASQMKEIIPVASYRTVYGYEHQSVINSLKHMFDFMEIESIYLEKVSLTFAVPKKQSQALEKQIAGSVHLFDKFEKLAASYRIME
jgi:putative IMPACT (imprinted ancient) family translation regulator